MIGLYTGMYTQNHCLYLLNKNRANYIFVMQTALNAGVHIVFACIYLSSLALFLTFCML